MHSTKSNQKNNYLKREKESKGLYPVLYMDEFSSKRASHGPVDSRKGSNTLLRETTSNGGRNSQFCNRRGCSGRSNSMKGTQIGKPSRPLLSSPSNSKEKIESSSTTCTVVSNPKKSSVGCQKKASSQLETDSSETSSVHDEPEVSKLSSPPGRIQRGIHLDTKNAKTSELSYTKVVSSSIASNTRSPSNFHQRSGLLNQDVSVGSSVCLCSKTANQVTHASGTKYGLRNLGSNSISDVVPSNSSSSDFSLSVKRENIKKKNSKGENSSAARGKKLNGFASGNNPTSNHGISISDSRRARNMLPSKDNGVASVRIRRSINGHARATLPKQGNGNSSSCNVSPVAAPQLSSPVPIDMNVSGLSQPLSAETPAVRLNSLNRPGSSNRSLHTEVGLPCSLMNRDSLRCYNMDGIAEVLLALERIEHDEELTVEQMLVLETNLFLSGLNLYDQHRDMRLDIDNMSYEELLALEERMGSVSTALTEDDLLKCLKRSIYQSIPPEGAGLVSSGDKDDMICSICQEKYVVGDEVGRLQCEHMYHVDCVDQWLRLKNWCPICKASASSPSSSPST